MGNQRRIAVQAPGPPQLDSASGRDRNSRTQSHWYLAMPGLQTIAHPSDSTQNPEPSSPEPTSRRRRLYFNSLASAGLPNVVSASRPTVPALGGGGSSCLPGCPRRERQVESLPLSRKERPGSGGVHSPARASMRPDHSPAGVSEGRSWRPAGFLPGRIPLTSRVERVRCRRFRGRTGSENFSQPFQT